MNDRFNIYTAEDLVRYSRTDVHGRLHLRPNSTFVLHHKISITGLHLTGNVEIRGVKNSSAHLNLTAKSTGITSRDIDKLTLRNLNITGSRDANVFDLNGRNVNVIDSKIHGSRIGRFDGENLSVHGLQVSNLQSGFYIKRANNLTFKFIKSVSQTGALIDLSTARLSGTIAIKDVDILEQGIGQCELLRLETIHGDNAYRCLFENLMPASHTIDKCKLTAKGVNSRHIILAARDKLVTALKLANIHSCKDTIIRPSTALLNRIVMSNISVLEP